MTIAAPHPLGGKRIPPWWWTLVVGAIGGVIALFVGRTVAAKARALELRDDAEARALASDAKALAAGRAKDDAEAKALAVGRAKDEADARALAAGRAKDDAEARALASEAKLRCELGSFTVSEVLALSESARTEFLCLCSDYGVSFTMPPLVSVLAQVPVGGHEAEPGAIASDDGRAG